MKKYVKPELFYESYELTQQIAACTFDLDKGPDQNLSNKNSCGFYGETEFGPNFILQGTNDGCVVKAEAYCYHGSTGGFNIFNS